MIHSILEHPWSPRQRVVIRSVQGIERERNWFVCDEDRRQEVGWKEGGGGEVFSVFVFKVIPIHPTVNTVKGTINRRLGVCKGVRVLREV